MGWEEITFFASEISIDVVAKTVLTKKVLRRLFWFVVLIIAVILTIYQTSLSVIYYYEYPTITTISVRGFNFFE